MAYTGHYSKVEIHAIARASAPDRLRMWVGVFDAEQPKRLIWSIDGNRLGDSDVEAIRLLGFMPDAERTQTGLYELTVRAKQDGRSGARPQYAVRVSAVWSHKAGSQSKTLVVRPLPTEVPRKPLQSFRVLLVSCFSEPQDRSGKVGDVVERLRRSPDCPDLVLTVGDQVYLDNPWVRSLLPTTRKKALAHKFEKKYRKNWQTGLESHVSTGYANVLRAAPVAAIPDDHEYWNNYPSASMPALSSFDPLASRNWAETARKAYDYFQHGERLNDESSYCYSIDVAPLSFFMLDNRTLRKGNLRNMRSMTDEQVLAYNDWVLRMIDTPGSMPVLVTGPSLFQNPSKHRWMDLNFADVEEYPTVINGLLRLSEAGRTPLALTGDVHYPRVTRARYDAGSPSRPWAPLHEVIASPASLVKGVKFINKPPIAAPSGNTALFDIDTRGSFRSKHEQRPPAWARLSCEKVWPPTDMGFVGNNIALLTFTRMPTGLNLSVRYLMIGAPSSQPDKHEMKQIKLRFASEAQRPPTAQGP
jgi:hypothetical protein